METPKLTSSVPWTAKDIIRNRTTGKPYLVVHVYINIGTEVMDLESPDDLTPVILLKPRVYDEYSLDRDFTLRGEQLQYEPISL